MKSIILIAKELLDRSTNPFNFILIFTFFRDHIELLSFIRRSFNENPSFIRFRCSIKKLLLQNSITPSNKSNITAFEGLSCDSSFSLSNNQNQNDIKSNKLKINFQFKIDHNTVNLINSID